jgi:ribonuclease Z
MRVEERPLAPDGTFAEDRRHRLRAVEVDHGTPCLAFRYEQKRGVRVRDRDLDRLGLGRGAWIRELKAAVLDGRSPDAPIDADGRRYRLGDLEREIAEVVPGAKVAYVSDTTLTGTVRERLVDLARDASVFFCEAKYLDRDRDKAAAARHLTALEAAGLARDAGVHELVLFHPSPRYEAHYGALLDEARGIFPNVRYQPGPAEELTGAVVPFI